PMEAIMSHDGPPIRGGVPDHDPERDVGPNGDGDEPDPQVEPFEGPLPPADPARRRRATSVALFFILLIVVFLIWFIASNARRTDGGSFFGGSDAVSTGRVAVSGEWLR